MKRNPSEGISSLTPIEKHQADSRTPRISTGSQASSTTNREPPG